MQRAVSHASASYGAPALPPASVTRTGIAMWAHSLGAAGAASAGAASHLAPPRAPARWAGLCGGGGDGAVAVMAAAAATTTMGLWR